MRLPATMVLMLVALGPAGCGASSNPPAIPGPKNGGSMNPLPDKKGYVEIRVEAVKGSGGGRGQVEPRTITAYFYGPDGTSALSPSPGDVSLKVGPDKVVPLAPAADGSSFASKPDNIPTDFRGSLDARIGGESISVLVSVR